MPRKPMLPRQKRLQEMFWYEPGDLLRLLLRRTKHSSKHLESLTGVRSTSIRAAKNGQTGVMRADTHLTLVRFLLKQEGKLGELAGEL